ncbi:glycosyltransferase family 2 protein [Acidipropionibacterium timonense]|uniref:glycosyltransferase family 2 protein n=1 Tax=Acidipropionibacterium timonense TaxID=2161818 RepID=UPI0010302353|nr:glycosyltransferase family A protein [Acidipropionibacterium timonense]
MPTASVIIPSRGGAGRLPRLLTALAAQTTDDWEAIVVLDGDIDDSASVVARYAHLPIRPIVFPENRGRVAALNAGHEAATGDILIRCDDDLEPAPDYVAKHIASHRDQVQGTIGLCPNVFPRTRYANVYGKDADARHQAAAYAADAGNSWRYWGGNVSVTRDTWNRVGPYDTRYRAYGWEDVDYGYRLCQAGVPVIIDPGLAAPHHGAATNTRQRVTRAFLSGRARQEFENMHGPGSSGFRDPDRGDPWNALVSALAERITYPRAITLSTLTDRAIHGLPAPMARKTVAALVEASSVAGFHSSDEPSRDV